MDQLNVAAKRGYELSEITTINGHDLVTVDCQQCHGSVDDVSEAGRSEKLTRGASEVLVKGADVDPVKRLSEPCLTRPTPPDLAKDTGVGEGEIADRLGRLESNPHRSFIAFEGHERSTVEHETHADSARRVGGRFVRTTTAPSRSTRCWARISSAVISPNSCS